MRSKILIVDDDANARMILNQLLVKSGYEVREATNGKEAFEMAKEFMPDVMILDWMMPEVDGEQLAMRIKNDPTLRFTYIILLTAKGEINDKVRGLQAGADDYISKPAPHQEVLARVESGMRMRSLYKEIQQLTKRLAVLELAATVGHEINNPLNVIYLALDMMRKYIKLKEYDKLEKGIELIAETAERLRKITRRFVELRDPQSTSYIDNLNMIDLRDEKEEDQH
ncbi:MAG TPA: response regulator [Candidatus Acidoferrales bacterium]|nr:response regulator [Candidatus Acidoferrales bacterium]